MHSMITVIRMNGCELTASISALASLMASRLSDSELALTAAVFTQLADTLATLAVQKDFCRAAEQGAQARGEGGNKGSDESSAKERI